jgi:hypothetical protein
MPINKFTTLQDLARQAKILSGETATFDGKIQAGIPFSGYPTGVDTGTTVSLGIVSSEDAVFSGNTGTTIFDVSNTGSTNYSPIFSGYSGSVWTNVLFSGNTSGLTLPITPLSADTQIVGPFWTLTQTGMTGDYVIGTQYTGYSITYSFFNVSQFGTGFTYSGFTTASQENFSAGTLDYKGPLDYISTKEDASVEGRLTTNRLTVTGGASAGTLGYVLTQTGDNGEVGWVFNSASGTTDTYVTGGTLTGADLTLNWNTGGSANTIDLSGLEFTGNTSGNCITDLYVTNIHGCSPITIWDNLQNVTSSALTGTYTNVFGNNNISSSSKTLIGGGENNTIMPKSNNSFVGSGNNNYIYGYFNFIGSGYGNYINGSNKGTNSILNGYTNTITGNTSNSSINSGKNNQIDGGSYHNLGGGKNNKIYQGKYNVISGGENNYINSTTDPSWNFIGGGYNNYIKENQYTSIVGGRNNSITGNTNYCVIGGGENNFIKGNSQRSIIGGGRDNTITASYSSVIGGQNNILNHSNSHIIGSNITSTENNTTYVENLTAVDDYIIHSNVIRLSGITSLADEIKGSVTNFDWSGVTSNLLWNSNPSGSTSFFFGNFDNWPTEKKYGFFSYYNSGFTRQTTTTTGPSFYQDKVVIKGADDSAGMVINPKDGDANATLWFEIDGESVMLLKGDGSTSGYLGIGLNPNGTEIPTERLQIGGTGTTGNILINGDIDMCSLSTGNTLFTSSISGCSPVTIQGHTTFDDNNFYGPQRPNYISEVITSGSTGWSGDPSNGIYTGITIQSGWVVEEIYYFVKTKDSNAGGGVGNLSRLVLNTTNGNIPNGGFADDDWNITYEGFNVNTLIPLRSSVIQDTVPIYFNSDDNLIIKHQDPTEATVGLTNGEFKILIKYWNGNGIL